MPRTPEKPTAGRIFSFAFAMSILLLPSPALAQDTLLTEQEAIRLALARPAFAKLTEGAVGVARSEATSAGLWDNPEIQYEREQTLGDFGTAQDSVTLTQRFDLSGRRGLKSEAAEKRVEAAIYRGESTRKEVEAAVRHRFYALLASQQRAAAAETWAGGIREALEIVSRRAAAGDASGYDLRRLERELSHAEALLAVHQAATARDWANLATTMGLDEPGTPQALSGALLPSAEGLGKDAAALIANHPEFLALNAEAAAANKDSAAAARGWIPQLTLGAGWTGIDGGSESADGYIAIIGLSIPIFDRKQGEAEMADAQAVVIQSQAEITQAESKAMALASVAELVHLTAAATRFRQEAVTQSRSLVDTAKAGYAGDELGILELLDAYRVASEDTLFAIDLELTARNTSIELERLIGGSTP